MSEQGGPRIPRTSPSYRQAKTDISSFQRLCCYLGKRGSGLDIGEDGGRGGSVLLNHKGKWDPHLPWNLSTNQLGSHSPCRIYMVNSSDPLTDVCVLTGVPLFVTLWTVDHQASLSMEFPRQEYWRGVAMSDSRRSS